MPLSLCHSDLKSVRGWRNLATVKNVHLLLRARSGPTGKTQPRLSARHVQQDGVASRLPPPVNHVTKVSLTQRTVGAAKSVPSTRIKTSSQMGALPAKAARLAFTRKKKESPRARTTDGKKPKIVKTTST